MPLGASELGRLAYKYKTLAELRRDRAGGGEPPPARVFKALAGEFPGALQELDTLPLEVIEERESALARAADGGEVSPWMEWLHGFHTLMRAALRVKVRLAGARDVSDDRARALALEAARHGPADDVDVSFVCAVARPPGGRITPVVLSRLAARFGADPDRIGDEIFPARAARRQRKR